MKAIESMALLLKEDITWAERAPNQRELFCLDFIGSYVDTFKVVADSFEWLSRCEDNESAVVSILDVYGSFVAKFHDQPTTEIILEPFLDNESQSVKKLFQWIISIQHYLETWKERIMSSMINYDEIISYKKHLSILQRMSSRMKVDHLVCSGQEVKEVKLMYESEFKSLNSLLLKPVPGEGQRRV